MTDLPSPEEVGQALANLGNWRVIHVQQALWPYHPVAASTLLSEGFRETALRNECGGANLLDGVWVKAYTDRGWLQITDTIPENAQWLGSVPGCKDGEWWPDPAGVSALAPMHCPRFSDALDYVKRSMLRDIEYGAENGVVAGPACPGGLQQFGVAAHNGGASGALRGYREGDVDKYTTHGDYSRYVMAVRPLVHNWIVAHPNWQPHPAG